MFAPGWRRGAWWECLASLVRNSSIAKLRFLWTFSNLPPVSPPTVLWRCLGTLLIFLHLLEETSLLVLLPVGLGACVEVFRTSQPAEGPKGHNWVAGINVWLLSSCRCGRSSKSFVFSFNGEAPNSMWALLRPSLFFFHFRTINRILMISSHSPPSNLTEQAKKLDEDEQRTLEYDVQVITTLSTSFFLWSPSWNPSFMLWTCLSLLQASRCLSYLLFPLCIGGTLFSLAYFRQKRWAGISFTNSKFKKMHQY